MAIYHVYPVNDLENHLTEEGSQCPCRPTLKIEDSGDLIFVHNSWDGREIWEQLLDDFLAAYIEN